MATRFPKINRALANDSQAVSTADAVGTHRWAPTQLPIASRALWPGKYMPYHFPLLMMNWLSKKARMPSTGDGA